MRKINEIFRLYHECGLSYHRIARSLNISSSTVSDYMVRARAAGLVWPFPAMTDEELHARLCPGNGGQFERKGPLPDWDAVTRELRRKGVTLRILWKEYIQTYPAGISYPRMCYLYRQHIKATSPVMRQIHKAGEKTFVDYAGMKVEWISQEDGEIHEAEIFVGCLGASQYIFAEAVPSQELPYWIASNVRMFEFFGGVTSILIPDNLLSGVTHAHRYDPDINQNFQLFGKHYGVAIVPARPSTPKDKAKVENAVGCVEKQILAALRHQTFTSIAEINAAIRPLLEKFNSQPFQKMESSRRQIYETVDKPALKPLPSKPFEYAEWKTATVNIDYHFSFERHNYSVPFRHIHKKIEVRATVSTVEAFLQGQRIASHKRSRIPHGYTTIHEHMPPAHAAQAEWTPERIQRWAAQTGMHTARFIEHLIASRDFPEQAFRSCVGVMRLGKNHGADRLEKACERALQLGFNRYKQIETMLKNRMESAPPSEASSPATLPTHDNIRGPGYYK